MSQLPKPDLWRSVGTGAPIKRRWWGYREFKCLHVEATTYSLLDMGQRGPTRAFKGLVCVRCGHVITRTFGELSDYMRGGPDWPTAYGPDPER